MSPASATRDINTDDESSGRRRPAGGDDFNWTVYIGGCSASMISPDILLTANHCQPQAGASYTSGAALAAGQQGDLSSTEVLEASSFLDYALVRVQWTNGSMPAAMHFPPKVATTASDVQVSASADQGDTAFTVGFPGDKRAATYSEGQLKDVSGQTLHYNLGIINGNSGGGVWRKSDKMLVSLTNNGPHQLGDIGWDQADRNDPGSWNSGPAAWEIYSQSQVLADVFPNGANRFNSPATTTLGADAFLLVETQADGTNYLWVAIADSLDHPVVCVAKDVAACNGTTFDFAFDLKSTKDGRKLFRSQRSAGLKDGMQLAVAGLDTTGALKSGAKLQLSAVAQ